MAKQQNHFLPHNDETVLLTLKPKKGSFLYLFLPTFLSYSYFFIFLSLFCGSFLSVILHNLYPEHASLTDHQFFQLANIYLLIVLAYIIIAVLVIGKRIRQTAYIITDKRIILNNSFFAMNTVIIPYAKITDISKHVNLYANIFKCATVIIDTINIGSYAMRRRRMMPRLKGLSFEDADKAVHVISQQLIKQ